MKGEGNGDFSVTSEILAFPNALLLDGNRGSPKVIKLWISCTFLHESQLQNQNVVLSNQQTVMVVHMSYVRHVILLTWALATTTWSLATSYHVLTVFWEPHKLRWLTRQTNSPGVAGTDSELILASWG